MPSIPRMLLHTGLSAVLLLASAVYTPGLSFPDRPPPESTGGHGSTHCGRCHFDQPVNEPGGSLVLHGLSGTFIPGKVYLLTLELSREDMRIAGFQLSARFAEGPGGQAGELSSVDDRVSVTETAGIQYAQQTLKGSGLTGEHTAGWGLRWQAPEDPPCPVVLHAAANAGNGDDSPLGDHIYTLELHLFPNR